MYKVFIDNKPVIYNCITEKALQKLFPDHKFVEAAGGLVMRGSTYLFIKRNGFWDIPKGKLDKGETPEQAAVREIEEECGLEKPVIKKHLLNTWHTYDQNGKNYLKKTYWYLLDDSKPSTKLVPQIEEGITELKFFKPGDFDVIRENTFLSILEVLEQLRLSRS